jgi:hypothetical protein
MHSPLKREGELSCLYDVLFWAPSGLPNWSSGASGASTLTWLPSKRRIDVERPATSPSSICGLYLWNEPQLGAVMIRTRGDLLEVSWSQASRWPRALYRISDRTVTVFADTRLTSQQADISRRDIDRDNDNVQLKFEQTLTSWTSMESYYSAILMTPGSHPIAYRYSMATMMNAPSGRPKQQIATPTPTTTSQTALSDTTTTIWQHPFRIVTPSRRRTIPIKPDEIIPLETNAHESVAETTSYTVFNTTCGSLDQYFIRYEGQPRGKVYLIDSTSGRRKMTWSNVQTVISMRRDPFHERFFLTLFIHLSFSCALTSLSLSE